MLRMGGLGGGVWVRAEDAQRARVARRRFIVGG